MVDLIILLKWNKVYVDVWGNKKIVRSVDWREGIY